MARPRRVFGAARHRLTQWLAPALQEYVAVASGGATLVAFAPFEEAVTLIRTRGVISIMPESVAADVQIAGAVGMGIVSAEARVAGVASIPEPFTDGDWGGWFVWRTFAMNVQFESAAGTRLQQIDLEIDSKAMRKITPNENLVVVAESFTGAFRLFTGTRHLIKLS